MKENAMDAPSGAYSTGRLQIQARIRQFAAANPKAKCYHLENDDEIAELLLTIAAVIKHALPAMPKSPHKNAMKLTANQCRAAVVNKRAASHFLTLQEGSDGEFEMSGLIILAPGQEAVVPEEVSLEE